jgi:hypothetical protein
VHPDDKKDNRKKDKTELGEVDEITLHNGKEECVDHIDDCKE